MNVPGLYNFPVSANGQESKILKCYFGNNLKYIRTTDSVRKNIGCLAATFCIQIESYELCLLLIYESCKLLLEDYTNMAGMLI